LLNWIARGPVAFPNDRRGANPPQPRGPVYNRALSDLEIAQLHSAESGTARNLKISIETVRLEMGLEPGRKYLLQSSPDLQTWTDFEAAFTATAAKQDMSVPVDEEKKFWRVNAAP
jgi:hypothetical protein